MSFLFRFLAVVLTVCIALDAQEADTWPQAWALGQNYSAVVKKAEEIIIGK